jgi:integrase
MSPCRYQLADSSELVGNGDGRFVVPARARTFSARSQVAPCTIQEAELLISRLRADRGGAISNYDEFRFFTGLSPSEQIALLVTDYDARRAVLSVTKARFLPRDKDRTKTQEDRDVEPCPRALEVLESQSTPRKNTSRPGNPT